MSSINNVYNLGVFASATPGNGALGLNTANTLLAMSFLKSTTNTLNGLWLYISTINGTSGNISMSVEVQGDNAGNPNGSAITGGTVSIAAGGITGTGWLNVTGFTCSMNAGSRYHIVVKNTASVPATDYPTVRYGASGSWSYPVNGPAAWGSMVKRHSTDNGANWGSIFPNSFGLRLDYSGGVYAGVPLSNVATLAAGSRIYSNRETGLRFIVPDKISVIGLCFYAVATGSPTGNLRFRLYRGNDVYTTYTSPAANLGANHVLYFSSAITLNRGDVVRCVMSQTAADSAANAYNSYTYTVHDNSDSRALLPFDGTAQRTETADSTASPVVWTDTNTEFVQALLVLAPSSPFVVPSGYPAVSDVTDGVIYGESGEYEGTKVCPAAVNAFRRYGRYGHRRVMGK